MEDKKLFVGGLSWDTTEDGLREFVSQVGEVEEVVIIKDRATGRSKGFGFVTMKKAEDSEKVIEDLNGKELDGRQVAVNKARPQENRE